MAHPWLRATAGFVCCAFLLAGCSKQANSDSNQPSATASPSPSAAASNVTSATTLTIGYTPGSGFNPYVANSNLVAQNAGLLFENLVELTPSMSLEYRIAQSIQSTGNMVLIQIRSGCTFADGTAITADDVAASLQAAKSSEMYSARFANVTKIETQGTGVQITLAQPDSMFAYLCDVPVLKASETASTQPTASGRYTYGESDTLVRNSHCTFAENGPEVINLTQVTSYDEMVSGLSMGSLNVYAVSPTAESTSNISSVSEYYKTNNLIFLGINASPDGDKSPILTTAAGRILLSQMANRRQLAEKGYYSRAYPATGIINNYYDCVASKHTILAEDELDAEHAAADFLALGYTKDPTSGYYQDQKGNRLTLRLTVYTGNTYKRYAASLLQEQFAAKGLDIELDEVSDFTAYSEKIATGDFDLYIGEVKLYNNMGMSPFFAGGQASYGIVQNEALLTAYTAFKADQSAAGAFEEAFAAEMPLVPLLWRNGSVAHTRNISGLSCSLSNVFYSLEGLTFEQTS